MSTERAWGSSTLVVDYNDHIKIKDMVIKPYTNTTVHWHENFNELVFVRSGTLTIYTSSDKEGKNVTKTTVEKFNSHTNVRGTWHSLCNEQDHPLELTVILHGSNLDAKLIERLEVDFNI